MLSLNNYALLYLSKHVGFLLKFTFAGGKLTQLENRRVNASIGIDVSITRLPRSSTKTR